MPHVDALLSQGTHGLAAMYSGLPSTTPAVQAELFYGVAGVVPAFAFLDRSLGRVVRMFEPDAVRAVERRLRAGGRSLLEGGGSYGNIYDGGAAVARFCIASIGGRDGVPAAPASTRLSRAARIPLVVLAHAPDGVRLVVLALRETVVAVVGLVQGLRRGGHGPSELKFAQSRIAVDVVLRELIGVAAGVDIARGLPVVYANLLGYDECAHRRGPDATVARAALRDIDAVIGRLDRAARRSPHRAYDLWVLSDHGQQATVPYAELFGASVTDTVTEVFRRHGLDRVATGDPTASDVDTGARGAAPDRSAGHGSAGDGRLLRLLARLVPDLELRCPPQDPHRVTVVALGPIGHVYPPRPLTDEERDTVASALVGDLDHAGSARIPLVLAAAELGCALAWTDEGRWRLPMDAARVLGADHPALDSAVVDLVALAHHPDAGALVLGGWRAGNAASSFPHEYGAHGGPGPEETAAFLLAPLDTPCAASRSIYASQHLRPADVRAAALDLLDGRTRRPAPPGRRLVAPHTLPEARRPGECRILTYNVHGCVGLDGVHDPERIARVIARHDPDVVCLQELDVDRPRSAGIDQAGHIAGLLDMAVHFHATDTVHAAEAPDARFRVAAAERSGNAILTRHPATLLRTGALPALAPLPGRPARTPRGALAVHVEIDGRALQVVTVHLGLQALERRLQVRALVGPDWLGGLRHDVPTVLCGDLNGFAWWPELAPLRRRLRDAQRAIGNHRPQATFAGRWPLWRIDHVFVDPRLSPVRAAVPGDPASRVASDHRPLVVDLALPDTRPGTPSRSPGDDSGRA